MAKRMPMQPGSRDKILLCARQMFHQVGYQATSVDDILAGCGVAKSNFYYHFKTKDELGLAVIDLEFQEYELQVAHSLGNHETIPRDRLRMFLEQICRSQIDHEKLAGCPFGNLAAALPNTDGNARAEQFRLRLSLLFRNMAAAIQICLQEGAEQGDFRADIPPSELAGLLLAVVEGSMLLAKTHRDHGPLVNGLDIVQKLLEVR